VSEVEDGEKDTVRRRDRMGPVNRQRQGRGEERRGEETQTARPRSPLHETAQHGGRARAQQDEPDESQNAEGVGGTRDELRSESDLDVFPPGRVAEVDDRLRPAGVSRDECKKREGREDRDDPVGEPRPAESAGKAGDQKARGGVLKRARQQEDREVVGRQGAAARHEEPDRDSGDRKGGGEGVGPHCPDGGGKRRLAHAAEVTKPLAPAGPERVEGRRAGVR
jgi:hypothetical protein